MEINILGNVQAVAEAGADIVAELVTRKKDATLGLATGGTPIAMYRRLVDLHREGRLSFRDVTTFNLDEYIGVSPNNPQSYRAYMQRELFDDIDIDVANTHLPECAGEQNPLEVGPAYEEKIRAAGGIDLQVLGIGRNGHIGFNEPTSSLASRTRIKTLTRGTVEANKRYFDEDEFQPELAITMGISTIMDAREVLLLATGPKKAEAVEKMIEGPVSAMAPASILQMHERVTVLLDRDAASALSHRDYYEWVQEQKKRLLSRQEGG
jgi:glucosamine-6-phosphate deaminase